ncbi:MAG: MaoC family dehydratase [Gammaproteobacteria bacterium]|nr:MaoC family dehydratase [Gammaproteobacteria bacterium]
MRSIDGIDQLGTLVGEEIAVGDWFEIDQARVARFADATNDHQWIHLDAERARRETPFGGTIAHGFLTLALLPFLFETSLRIEGVRMVVNYGLERVRFPAPVRVGSRIRARVALERLAPIPGGAQAEWRVTVEREAEARPGCVATALIHYYA